jgi:hypothetical protein
MRLLREMRGVSFGYDPRTATGVHEEVLQAHLRNGEDEGGMLDCIFRTLLYISQERRKVVVFCNHGKHRTVIALV